MKTKQDKDILFSKYLDNKCTPREKHQLYELLVSSDNEKSFKEVLFSHLAEFQTDQDERYYVDFNRIYNEILAEISFSETKVSERQHLQKRNNTRKLVIEIISIAAVSCIAFFIGSIFSHRNNVSSPVSSQTISYNEITAPLGAKSEIKLNDGTEVMLNAGSTIKFSTDYNFLNRDLALEGEAYFKVAKNTGLPLVVNAGNIKIKATGTEFNVKAYSDEGIIETTLVNGTVEISQNGNNDRDGTFILKPNQKAIYASETDKLTLEKIKEIEPAAVRPARLRSDKLLVAAKTDVEQATAWTKNKLIIRSENLESLCTKLQRKYNVTFIFADEEIKKNRFSGVLLDETFQQVMDVIKLTAPVNYLLSGKTVLLFSNNDKAEKYSNKLNTDKI